MLKITCVEQADDSALWVAEGRLVGPWVREMEKTLVAAVAICTVRLDVSALGYVDQKGLKLLHRLQDRGVELVAVSPFLHELMTMSAERR